MEYYEYRVVRSSTDTDKAYFLKCDLDQQLLIIKSGDSSIEDKVDAFERLKGTLLRSKTRLAHGTKSYRDGLTYSRG